MTPSEDHVLRDSLRGILASASSHDSISEALDDQGWREIVSADGDRAWRILFEEFATALAPAHPLDLLLEPVVAGAGPATHLVYATERSEPQRARDARLGRPDYPRGVVRASRAAAGRYVVLTVRQDGSVTAAAADAGDVSLEPVQGLDPDLHVRVAQLHAAPRPLAHPDRAVVAAAIDRAQVLHSYALRALSDRMLGLAIEHVTGRRQFGRPVGSFQAVKHMLANCAVELESLRAVLAYASESLDPVAITAARALAGRTSAIVAQAAQQSTGAMGFSWEFPLHRYIRRAHSYDMMLGPWPRHTHHLGQLILGRLEVPRVGGA